MIRHSIRDETIHDILIDMIVQGLLEWGLHWLACAPNSPLGMVMTPELA